MLKNLVVTPPFISRDYSYLDIVRFIESGDYKSALAAINSISSEIIAKDHTLLNAYGIVLRALGRYDDSIKQYRLALSLDPTVAGTWSNLGNALKDANYIDASIQAHIKAIELSDLPGSKLWHNYGISLAIAGKHVLAIDAYEKALGFANSNPAIRWDLARSQLALKNYSEGFANYQYRWLMDGAPPKRVSGKEWNGEKLNDEELFIYAEQGFGDYIQCARYLPELKKRVKNLIVEVKPELKVLMENSFPLIQFTEYIESPFNRERGYIFSLLDLPRYLMGISPVSTVQYLAPKRTTFNFSNELNNKLLDSRRLNVGVVWSGSITFKRNAHRSAEIDWFLKNLNFPNTRLFSLQMGPRSSDLGANEYDIISPELLPHIQDFNDTAQILQKLDLVVMTCSSVAHLCGALNVPCWVLLDSSPHWLWGGADNSSDWYASLKLFRQKSPGDWKFVFDKVSAELMNKNKYING